MALRDDVRRYGLARTLCAVVLRRLARHLGVHIWSIQTRPIAASYDMPEELARRFTFKQLTLNDALLACRSGTPGLSESFVREAFDRGDICVGGYDGDKLINYNWRTTTHAPVTDDLWLRVHGSNLRYGYKALVLPEYRGMRLSMSTARFFDHYFVSGGIDTDIGYVDLHNLASMKNTFRDPNRLRVGYGGYLRIGDRYWPFMTKGVRKYLSFEVRPQG